ncbi:putative Cytochrome P450 [Seiridium unicorne]|uniref:Cytochrome P450 n=1 Tax=Seiridium unicorne TaxID=138068 RepID=A0ABR2UVG9_9PEZI
MSALVSYEPSVHECADLFTRVSTNGKAAPEEYVSTFTMPRVSDSREKNNESLAELQSSNRAQCFLFKFFKKHEENPGKFHMGFIQLGCDTSVFAGSDATAISLSSIFYHLLQNPKVVEKLREELAHAEENGSLSERPTFKEAQDLEYLQAIIKEASRLHPATGLPLERLVPEGGTTIAGQFFPAGTTVGVNTWVEHRDPRTWGPDAEQFRPERWLISDESPLAMMNRHWIPLGAGSRLHIGKNILLLEVIKLAPRITRDFDWELHGHNKTHNFWFVKPERLDFTVSSRNIRVVL